MSDQPVLRQVKMHELFSMLDYEGKVEARHWSIFSQRAVLSPPAKIIQTFLGKAAETIAAVLFHEHDMCGQTSGCADSLHQCW